MNRTVTEVNGEVIGVKAALAPEQNRRGGEREEGGDVEEGKREGEQST